MNKTRFNVTVAAMVAIVAVSIFAFSCATIDRVVVAPPMISGAKYVGMETCQPCHEKQVRDFKLTSHARMQIASEKVEGQGCEGCHGPGSLHVEAGGVRGKFILNPSKDPKACYQCHLEKQAQMNLPYHHPVREGRMSCVSCHDPHGSDIKKGSGLVIARVNDTCAQCHREQAGPHVFEHEAMREGCTICHQVHGSINPKMLAERSGVLCLKCHAQVASLPPGGAGFAVAKYTHNNDIRRGACFSAGCHTAPHGSDVSPLLRY